MDYVYVLYFTKTCTSVCGVESYIKVELKTPLGQNIGIM